MTPPKEILAVRVKLAEERLARQIADRERREESKRRVQEANELMTRDREETVSGSDGSGSEREEEP